MIEKGNCDTCVYETSDGCRYDGCGYGKSRWKPSRLYTAYLQERERTEKVEARAEFIDDILTEHQELLQKECELTGKYRTALQILLKHHEGDINGVIAQAIREVLDGE